MEKEFDFFGFKKAIENEKCIIFEITENGKTSKVINYDKHIDKYRFSNYVNKKEKFDESDKLYTKHELVKALIIENIYYSCELFNIDDLEVISEMSNGLNYHRAEELKRML
ncbi:MAG: hypothetical protein ABIG64_00005 [Candidatus Omnitrophota bacterium]